jgi:hypothetical protein
VRNGTRQHGLKRGLQTGMKDGYRVFLKERHAFHRLLFPDATSPSDLVFNTDLKKKFGSEWRSLSWVEKMAYGDKAAEQSRAIADAAAGDAAASDAVVASSACSPCMDWKPICMSGDAQYILTEEEYDQSVPVGQGSKASAAFNSKFNIPVGPAQNLRQPPAAKKMCWKVGDCDRFSSNVLTIGVIGAK